MREAGPTAQLGGLVRTARLAQGLTQEQLAGHTGLVSSQISLLEGGKRLPSLFAVLRILGAVGLPIESLHLTEKGQE